MIRRDILKIIREKQTLPEYKLIFDNSENRTEITKPNINDYLVESIFDLKQQDFFYRDLKTFIEELGFQMKYDFVVGNSVCDIFIEEKNIGFKFLGLFDFSEINVFKKHQLNTYTDFTENDFKIIQIFEDTWFNKKEIIKSRIKNILGVSDIKIYARKTKIVDLSSKKSEYTQMISQFLLENHSQGKVGSKYKYGLMYGDEVVSLMVFGGLRKNLGQKGSSDSYELLRFVNKLNTNVVGGASKLFKYFIKKHNVKSIISYADKNWSNSKNNIYTSLGLKYVHDSDPSYFYIRGDERKGRFGYRKDVLLQCGYDGEFWGEHTICLINNMYRIYDVGTAKYEYVNNKYISAENKI